MPKRTNKILFTLLGKPFEMVYRRLKAYGDCSPPDGDNCRTIRVRHGLSEQDELDTIIHECIHGCGWHIDEEFVCRAATDIAKLLIQAGWKKCPTKTQ